MLRVRSVEELPKGLRSRIGARHRPADQWRADEKAVASQKRSPARSRLEDMAYNAIVSEGLPAPEREVHFIPGRRFRFDLAWPDQKIAVEVQGATWSHGRHVRGAGYEMDCRKMVAANVLGWTVLYATQAMIVRGELVVALEALLGQQEPAEAVRQIFPPHPKLIRDDGQPLREISEFLRANPGATLYAIRDSVDMSESLVRKVVGVALVSGAIIRTGTWKGYKHWLPDQVQT